MKRFKPGVSFGDFVVTDVMTKKERGKEETPVDYRRGWVIWLAVLAVIVGLAVRLGALQIFEGGKYRILADENRVKKIRLPAPRGPILDRNGVNLVTLAEAAAHVVGYLGEVGEEAVGASQAKRPGL